MATTLPASLKTPDISRFAQRAAQLEKVKPVIWYWSSFHVLNQILEKNLHTTDGDAMAYTMKLMDDVEQFKAANSTNDAISDEIAAKAYVEQFGLDTFARADNTVRANKATRQTADTFLAAGTFLDLLNIWGPLEPESAAKSKYAKFHALRIGKALKAGEDPNLSNPKQEQDVEESLPPLDPNDAEVKALAGEPSNSTQPPIVDNSTGSQNHMATSTDPTAVHQQQKQQPFITEIPDETLPVSHAPSLPRPSGEAVSPLVQHDAASFYANTANADVSPLEAPAERKPSIGGNYFPIVPPAPASDPTQQPPTPSAQVQTISASSAIPQAQPPVQPPVQAAMSPPNTTPYGTFAPPSAPSYQPSPIPQAQPPTQPPSHPQQPSYQPQPQFQQPSQPSQTTISPSPYATSPPAPAQYYQQAPQQPYPPHQPSYTPQPSQPYPVPAQQAPTSTATTTTLDEEALMKAQKHARWAISALNFEDVQTAIRELEGALRVLGAR